MTIESKPHCPSFSNSSRGVSATSLQSSGSWRGSTTAGEGGGAGGGVVLELAEVEVALAVRPVEHGEAQSLPERRPLAQSADQVAVERADRALRDPIVGGVTEDDVLVSVVGLRRQPHLRPFPAEER